MSSLLRYAVTLPTASPVPTTQKSTATSPRPAKKQKMSLTQTYYLAHTARGKLSKEAARGDHDLRLLVGHANLLDSLMLELANAEAEQESWFNQTVKSAAKASSEESNSNSKSSQRVTWADQHSITEEELFDDDEDSDTESEVDSDDEIEQQSAKIALSPRKIHSQPTSFTLSSDNDDEDAMEIDDDEYAADLSLTRTPSRKSQPQPSSPAASSSSSLSTSSSELISSPPELLHEDFDSEDDSDSDSDSVMPPSPQQTELVFVSEKDRHHATIIAANTASSSPLSSPSPLVESHQIAIAAY